MAKSYARAAFGQGTIWSYPLLHTLGPCLQDANFDRHSKILPLPTVKDEPRRHLARRVQDSVQHSIVSLPNLVRSHAALELLGFCERQVVVALPADSTSKRRVRTPLPHSPATLGDHVLTKRKDLGLPQGQLARLLGVWRASLGSWEANHYEPTGSVRARVIAWLGFDPIE